MRQIVRTLACCLIITAFATTADAQYRKYQAASANPGEDYHIELSGAFWSPDPSLIVSSEQFGIVGSDIDAVKDLGFEKTRFKEIRLVLRPAKKHKFRFDYIPMTFEGDATLQRDITFNGILYKANLPVQSKLEWKALHVGYEYDFIYRDRWFLGFILEAKYTDVKVALDSPIDSESASAAAPIPAVGGILRIYPIKGISVTGEVTGFKLPGRVDDSGKYDGEYLDYNIYGTFNVMNNVGVQVGYRSIDVMYRVDSDRGDFKLKGMYFGGVVRF